MEIILALTYFDVNGVFTGGTQSLVKLLSTELSGRGHDVKILTVNHDKISEKKDQITKTVIKERVTLLSISAYEICRIKFLGRHLLKHLNARFYFRTKKIKKEIDESCALIFFDVNEMSFPLCLLREKKLKLFYCCTMIEREKYFTQNYLPRKLLKICADYYLVSNSETENALNRLDLDSPKTMLLPYGIETGRFMPLHDIHSDKEGLNVIGYIGGIEERKGLHVLLKACRILKTKFTLLIAGPPREEKYYKDALREISLINDTGLGKVEYLGRISDDELTKFYNRLDIFVCPSLIEEFGIVILEAMACEVPVVASAVGGITTIISDGVDGVLSLPGDADDMAGRIEKLLNDKTLVKNMGIRAREKILKNYSITRTADGIEELINSKITGNKLTA
ncbi:MAG: glycosyltransferase family 4 protein [Candidatus Schekmanbacteria bacterium]|nr:glycosyltransferase family 4 protein [Candidatus Schekmanbacteria bacterium]